MKGNKGITLIALVITIIVLLILAGVSIAMLSGNNSILSRSREAGYKTAISNAKEQIIIGINEAMTDYYNEVYASGNATTATAEGSTILSYVEAKLDAGALAKQYEGVEVKRADNVITITYKNDTTKKSTGTFDTTKNDASISWVETW